MRRTFMAVLMVASLFGAVAEAGEFDPEDRDRAFDELERIKKLREGVPREGPGSGAPPAGEVGPGSATPARQRPPLTWVLELSGERGTNELYSLSFSNGSTMSIGANTGLCLSGGVSFLPLAEGRLRTRATVGVKYTGQSATNGRVDYYAFPVEVVETLELRPIRLGAGVYTLLAPTLSGSGVASNISTHFDSTVGFTARAEWVFGGRTGVGVRYVWNRLSVGGQSLSAPAFGIILSLNGWVGD